ncbi:hypothetical protein DV736_g4311, partial [Chaetothyriales sp. CBS 134916]
MHAYLSDKCLALLQSPGGLRKDICQLQHPGVRREHIDETTVIKHIPPYLQYACRYWVYHLQHSGCKIRDDNVVAEFLRQHFLHWLESLSLMGKISESVNLVVTLKSLVGAGNSKISAFLEDARRFMLTFNPILAQAPLQVYASAWHFSHSNLINSVVFSPDGSRVASGSYDMTVQVWDTQTGECQHTLKGHSDSVNSVVFSPDGSYVVSGSNDKTVRVWDTQTGECQHTLEGHSNWVKSVVFSPDGVRMVSGSYDKTVRVWDTQTGECQHILKGHSNWVTSVVFSPDGSRVASGSYDNMVRVWDTQTGECQHTLEGHSDSVKSVVFSPDGSRMASGSYDNMVRVWDTQTGECQHTLEGHSNWVKSVVFTLDGSRVALAPDSNTTITQLFNGDPTLRVRSPQPYKSIKSDIAIKGGSVECFVHAEIHTHGGFRSPGTHGRVYDQWTIPDLAEYGPKNADILRQTVEVMSRTIKRLSSRTYSYRPCPMESRVHIYELPPASTATASIQSLRGIQDPPNLVETENQPSEKAEVSEDTLKDTDRTQPSDTDSIPMAVADSVQCNTPGTDVVERIAPLDEGWITVSEVVSEIAMPAEMNMKLFVEAEAISRGEARLDHVDVGVSQSRGTVIVLEELEPGADVEVGNSDGGSDMMIDFCRNLTESVHRLHLRWL